MPSAVLIVNVTSVSLVTLLTVLTVRVKAPPFSAPEFAATARTTLSSLSIVPVAMPSTANDRPVASASWGLVRVSVNVSSSSFFVSAPTGTSIVPLDAPAAIVSVPDVLV